MNGTLGAEMAKRSKSVTDEVLTALQLALQLDDMEVAEHLLRALEVLAARDEVEEDAQRIYRELVRLLRSNP